MILGLGAGALILLVVAILLAALWRGGGQAAARADYDMQVYKDQLGEIDRDLARGVLTETEAKAARLEIERRLLKAAEPGKGGKAAPAAETKPAVALIASLAAFVPVASLGLYIFLGSPDLPGQPLAQRQDRLAPSQHAGQQAGQQPAGSMEDAIGQLASRLEANPENVEGWILLARSYTQVGRYRASSEAYARAVEQGADDPQVLMSYAEMLTAVADGNVPPKAKQLIEQTLAAEPRDPRARYYFGLSQAQAGKTRDAFGTWMSLASDTPAEAPWRNLLEQQITAAAETLGEDLGEIPVAVAPPAAAAPSRAPALAEAAPGPTAEDVEQAQEMTDEERSAFIRSMVDRLASRLEDEPQDLDGWLRLARAYVVLGEAEKAREAFGKAEDLTRDLPPDAPERAAVRDAAEDALKSLE